MPRQQKRPIMTASHHSRETVLHRTGLRFALVLSAALLLAPANPAMAQDVAAPDTETSAPAEPQSPAPAESTGSGSAEADAPASGAAPATEQKPQPADTPAAGTPASAAPAVDAEPVTAPTQAEPAPSLLDDPAAALSQMLSQPEKRSDLPHDLSPWGMFMAADWVVKAVMIGLALASLLTWTVWLAKSIEIACARARAKRVLGIITRSSSLKDAGSVLARRGGPAAYMVRLAEEEMQQSAAALDHAGNDGVKERIASSLGRIEAQAGRRLTRGTGVLATIGSTAPFVGLFGTVWGIMNSFIGISEAQTTNLAIVAPGIAEALLATAIGLVAAIPAVVIYNVFARSITGYRQLLGDAAAGVERLASRDLDFRLAAASMQEDTQKIAAE